MDERPLKGQDNEHTPLPVGKRTQLWQRILLGIIILLSGIVIGTGGTLILGKDMILDSIRRDHEPARTAEKLGSLLNLSADQQKQVEGILSKRLSAIHEIKRESFPRIHEQFDLMKKEVAAVLNDRQKITWNEETDLIERVMLPRRPHHPRNTGDRASQQQ